MKSRFLLLILALLILSACGLPARRVVSYQGTFRPDGDLVRAEDKGFALFGLIDFDKAATGVEISTKLREKYQCSRLSNIEVTYTDWYFWLFSFPTTTVTASCLKGSLETSE